MARQFNRVAHNSPYCFPVNYDRSAIVYYSAVTYFMKLRLRQLSVVLHTQMHTSYMWKHTRGQS